MPEISISGTPCCYHLATKSAINTHKQQPQSNLTITPRTITSLLNPNSRLVLAAFRIPIGPTYHIVGWERRQARLD